MRAIESASCFAAVVVELFEEGELDEKVALVLGFGVGTGMRRGNGEGPPLSDERRVDVDVDAALFCCVSLRGIVVD